MKNKGSNWFRDMALVFANEFRIIFRDPGVMIFFIVLPLLYPIVYTLIYNKELVEQIPVAVVDNSRTADSREFVRVVGASPTILIYDYANDMGEARRMMAERKVYGVLEIPANYSKNIGNLESAHVTFYSDMSLLLRYRAFMAALADVQVKLAGDITGCRIAELGGESYITGDSILPVDSQSNFLGDVEQGFASFVIPGILMIILQQSMLLGIGMLEGTARERRCRNGGIDPREIAHASVFSTVWGKALCFFVLYIALAIYNVRIVPWMFRLPMFGDPTQYLLLLVPYLLAVTFFGQSLAPLMRERESPFVIIVATSLVMLFLSGLTWPRPTMSPFWRALGDIVPSTWGVEAFIRINSNAATLEQNSTPFFWLWGLTVVYMVTAMLATRYSRRRARREAE